MKTHRLIFALIASIPAVPLCQAASISQTFEAGEDTTNWGSTWTGGSTVSTFLDPGFGGISAGGGASLTQSFSRNFRNNTAGLDVETPYMISMYVQVDSFDGAAGGLFEIVDGSYGSNNAANLRILTVAPDQYKWQARDNNSGWQDVGMTLLLTDPYRVELTVDPASFTYSATVSSVDGSGGVIQSATLNNLAFDQNVINNNANGNLLFYIQANAGGTDVRVDNINIQSIPEPAMPLVAGSLAVAWTLARRRGYHNR